MPLTKPMLTRATPGSALTAGQWNAVIDGVGGLYDVLGPASRDYELALTWRGRPVRDARVVGFPVDGSGNQSGPALAAVAPVGDLTTHHLVGVRPGPWRILVEAHGFAPATLDVPVDDIAGGSPAAPTHLELTRTTVPIPDLVGLSPDTVSRLADWTNLSFRVSEPLVGPNGVSDVILIQGPSGGDMPGPFGYQFGSPPGVLVPNISTLFAGRGASQPLWRSVVPELLGWTGPSAAFHVTSEFGLTIGKQTGSPDLGTRVTAQNPTSGQIVAAGTPIDLTYVPAPDDQARFGLYPTTHPALAKTLVRDVATALQATIGATKDSTRDWALIIIFSSVILFPWEIARTYLSDSALQRIVDFFASFNATASDPARDLPAIWASFAVTNHLRWP